jgi:hypothetical protein
MDVGIQKSIGLPVVNPLPISWLGRADAPPTPPRWTTIDKLSSTNIRNLTAQLGYDRSGWDYTKIGPDNELGRYQFTTQTLEDYGLIAPGSNDTYGIDCVNRLVCWRPIVINNGINQYANYFYNCTSLTDFQNNITAQEHLAYQQIVNLYYALLDINAIKSDDTADIVAGMISVSLTLGVGTPSGENPLGTGAYAWRYFGASDATDAFNAGRYSVLVLG